MTEPTSTIPVPTTKPATSNKRRSRRVPPRTSTRIRVYRTTMGLGPNIASGLLDVSESGARLKLKESAKLGQEIEINLESAAGGQRIKAVGTVVWVVPAADGTFIVGTMFQKTIGFMELQALSRL